MLSFSFHAFLPRGHDKDLGAAPGDLSGHLPRDGAEATLYTLPGNDIIVWKNELLTLLDDRLNRGRGAVSFVGISPKEIDLFWGFAKEIAEDFAAKEIERVDKITASLDSEGLSIAVAARARDKTKYSLSYSGARTRVDAIRNRPAIFSPSSDFVTLNECALPGGETDSGLKTYNHIR